MDILFLQTPAATLVEAPSWAKAIGGLVGPAGVAWLVAIFVIMLLLSRWSNRLEVSGTKKAESIARSTVSIFMWFFILPLIIFIFVNIFSVVNGLGAINILFFGKWIALTFSSYWWLIQCALGAEAVQGELLTYSPDAIIRLIWIFLPLSFIWLRSFKTWPLRLVLGILIIVSMVLTANKKAGQTFITADVGIENLQKIPIIGSLFAAPTPVINGQTVAKKGMSANRRKIIASALALVLVIGIVMALYFAKTVTQKMLGLLIITIGIFGFWFVAPASVNKELKKLSQNKDHAININIDSLVAQMQLFARDSNRMELYNTAQKLKEAYKAQAEFTKFPDSLCLEFKDYFYERCH